MVRMNKEWPEEGDLIVGTVHKVLGYGAFAKLEEYEGKEAFIHISEVSSGWVKNIRDYVRENQKIVARVLRVNPKKGHVDASLKRIREDQRTRRIQQWKIEQKAEKLLEISANSNPSYKSPNSSIIRYPTSSYASSKVLFIDLADISNNFSAFCSIFHC